MLMAISLSAGVNVSWAGVEEDRLDRAGAQLTSVVGRYQAIVESARGSMSPEALGKLGSSLWSVASADVRGGHPDDRSLYWTRLAVKKLLGSNPELSTDAIEQFELASRGLASIDFPTTAEYSDEWKVLITGFDPFHLDENISQSNPSGLAALAFDGLELSTTRGPARIEAAIMPVRFADFDAGIVESFLAPYLESDETSPDLIVTISMGRDAFDLERFPGRRRSAQVPDNENVLTGGSLAEPLIPMLDDQPLAGPEFVEFSLPALAMTSAQGRWPVRDNRNVMTLQHGAVAATSLIDLEGLTAVSGSGGGYLSNEISYRALRLGQLLGSEVLIGHIHTPRIEGFDADMEMQVVEQLRRMLIAAVEALP
jgi:pyrrolidone-carboxylate peptidase